MVRSNHTYKLFDVEGLNGPMCRYCEMPVQQGARSLIVSAPGRRHTLDTIFGADLGDIADGPIRTRVLPHLIQQGKLFCQRDAPAVVPIMAFAGTYGKLTESTTEAVVPSKPRRKAG